MLYPINQQINSNNINFKKQVLAKDLAKTKGIATINYQLYQKISSLKETYIEIINKVKSSDILATKIASDINNIKIDDSGITVMNENNKKIKLSIFEIGLSKLFRIKLFENDELKNIVTFDNYKIVDHINKNEIFYSEKDSINEQEIDSMIEYIYAEIDKQFLDLRKYIQTGKLPLGNDLKTRLHIYEQTSAKKEIVPGVTADMLPKARTSEQEQKPLFSYAAFIENSTQAKKIKKDPIIEDTKNEIADASLIEPKKERTKKIRLEHKADASKKALKNRQIISTKKTENQTIGIIPRICKEKIILIEVLYDDINELLKKISPHKLLQIKKSFNIITSKKHGFYFEEPNGDKLSVIKLKRKDPKDPNLLKVSFNSAVNLQNIFAVISNSKNLVSNISEKNYQKYNLKPRYQTQNEVNNLTYQGSFQVILDKIIKKFSEIKKALINHEWKKNYNEKIGIKTNTNETESKKINITSTHDNFILDDYLVRSIKNLWEELKATDELRKLNNIIKKDFEFIIVDKGGRGFNFKDKDQSILINKSTRNSVSQYKIVVKDNNNVVKEAFVMTENGFLIKNHNNGELLSSKLSYIKNNEDTNKIIASMVKYSNKLKKMSRLYKKDLEQKIQDKTNSNSQNQLHFGEEINNIKLEVNEVNNITEKKSTESDNSVVDVKKEQDIIYKLKELVKKIKQKFNEVLSKLNKNK